jgi:hypothetical protein
MFASVVSMGFRLLPKQPGARGPHFAFPSVYVELPTTLQKLQVRRSNSDANPEHEPHKEWTERDDRWAAFNEGHKRSPEDYKRNTCKTDTQ